jgi:hypothetical protein
VAKKTSRDNERRAIAEQLRKEQARKEKRRSLLILGACIVVVLGLLAAALIPYVRQVREDNRIKGTALTEIGPAASAAACDPVKRDKATGSAEHVPPPQEIEYPQAPPASGPHWGNFLQGSEIRQFYSVDDRPEIERLVHSLEHGHTILWYDDTVKSGTDAYQDIRAMAEKFEYPDDYFIAAPWTGDDGDPFPEGKHVAITHWTGPDNQEAVTQYCAAPSGEAVGEFMKEFPKDNAPEPGAA